MKINFEKILGKGKKPCKTYRSSYFINVKKGELQKTLTKLKLGGVGHISAISGYDNGKEIEVNYHFSTRDGEVVTIKTKIPRKNPEIQTITNIYAGAVLYERELYEMFDVKIRGHPDLRKLFLDKNSPKAPLRRKQNE